MKNLNNPILTDNTVIIGLGLNIFYLFIGSQKAKHSIS